MGIDQRSPHEPEEPYQSTVFEEPDEPELGPDIPDIEPDVDEFWGPSNTDPELLFSFWWIVVLLNVGIMATSIGLLLIGFRGEATTGGIAILVGIFALVRGYQRYRSVRQDDELWDTE